MRKRKGALTIEASISYSIFLMVIVTMLYLMRVVYAYGLIQHAVSQTAKELSMYTYIYQVTGLNDAYQDIQNSVSGRKDQFNQDVGNVVSLYDSFSNGDFSGTYEGETDPVELLKNIGSVMLGEGSRELNEQLFQLVVHPLMKSYIGADSKGNSADDRLRALQIIGGMKGLDFSSSSFFEDGKTIDLVVCYTIDPILPIDIMPEMNMVNRAYVRGMSGKSVFERKSEGQKEETSIWDMPGEATRGKEIQEQEHARNLPDNFPVFAAYDASTGTATAVLTVDLREKSYQKMDGLKGLIQGKCNKMYNYKTSTLKGVTVEAEDIKDKVLTIYIPSSTEKRKIDRSLYDQVIKEVRKTYPDIQIVTKELD